MQPNALRLATHREVSMLGLLVLRLESEMSPTMMTLHGDTVEPCGSGASLGEVCP